MRGGGAALPAEPEASWRRLLLPRCLDLGVTEVVTGVGCALLLLGALPPQHWRERGKRGHSQLSETSAQASLTSEAMSGCG